MSDQNNIRDEKNSNELAAAVFADNVLLILEMYDTKNDLELYKRMYEAAAAERDELKPLVATLKATRIEELSPLDAMTKLYELKRLVSK